VIETPSDDERGLAVSLGGVHVGDITRSRRGATYGFAYSADWLGSPGATALSVSLPLRPEPFSHDECSPFFAGLLPEGGARQTTARRLGVSEQNDVALLEALGGDCAGAISIGAAVRSAHAAENTVQEGTVQWLSEDELAGLLADLPRRPLLGGAAIGVRLSLAGAQDKAPIRFDGARYGLPIGTAASTHILKTPIPGFPATVVNEALCLATIRALGLPAVEAVPVKIGDVVALRVERYDRVVDGDVVGRVHQEDVCQALGVPPQQKYEAEGGPGVDTIAALLRAVSARPAIATRAFLELVVAWYLLGNADGHGKNVSLLRGTEGIALSRAYDVLCTATYEQHDERMAMRIGREYRPARVERRHWERFVDGAGFSRAFLRRIRELATRAPQAVRTARGDIVRAGWDDPLLASVVEIVDGRAGRVIDALSS
jgi:serine/threonine-protein kinase HipA